MTYLEEDDIAGSKVQSSTKDGKTGDMIHISNFKLQCCSFIIVIRYNIRSIDLSMISRDLDHVFYRMEKSLSTPKSASSLRSFLK